MCELSVCLPPLISNNPLPSYPWNSVVSAFETRSFQASRIISVCFIGSIYSFLNLCYHMLVGSLNIPAEADSFLSQRTPFSCTLWLSGKWGSWLSLNCWRWKNEKILQTFWEKQVKYFSGNFYCLHLNFTYWVIVGCNICIFFAKIFCFLTCTNRIFISVFVFFFVKNLFIQHNNLLYCKYFISLLLGFL